MECRWHSRWPRTRADIRSSSSPRAARATRRSRGTSLPGASTSFTFVPMVDRSRWLEAAAPVNISHRWNRDKTDDLQYAFFNGEGWESWENIWGIWNGITPRDGEATRRVATIERALAPFFVSEEWQPFYPTHRTASSPADGRSASKRYGPSSIAMSTTSPAGRFYSL